MNYLIRVFGIFIFLLIGTTGVSEAKSKIIKIYITVKGPSDVEEEDFMADLKRMFRDYDDIKIVADGREDFYISVVAIANDIDFGSSGVVHKRIGSVAIVNEHTGLLAEHFITERNGLEELEKDILDTVNEEVFEPIRTQ